jgi:hypothetical protein
MVTASMTVLTAGGFEYFCPDLVRSGPNIRHHTAISNGLKPTSSFPADNMSSCSLCNPASSRNLTWEQISGGIWESAHGVWGSSAEDVFAVGDQAAILHYDGVPWNPMQSPATWSLYGVWGSSPEDVLAVGEGGTILHYDGVIWEEKANSRMDWGFEGVWGSSAENVFAVGERGKILHYGPRH